MKVIQFGLENEFITNFQNLTFLQYNKTKITNYHLSK